MRLKDKCWLHYTNGGSPLWRLAFDVCDAFERLAFDVCDAFERLWRGRR